MDDPQEWDLLMYEEVTHTSLFEHMPTRAEAQAALVDFDRRQALKTTATPPAPDAAKE